MYALAVIVVIVLSVIFVTFSLESTSTAPTLSVSPVRPNHSDPPSPSRTSTFSLPIPRQHHMTSPSVTEPPVIAATATSYEAFNIVVNKTHRLPEQYVPDDLVVPDIPFSPYSKKKNRYLRQEAASALERMVHDALAEDIALIGVSAYRSFQDQRAIYDRSLKKRGRELTEQYIAPPGASEHQTGLAIDLSCASIQYALIEAFSDTHEGKWLAHHAPAYGFIIRYPKNKQAETGYAYEPWHIRYVGVTLAQEATNHTLELLLATQQTEASPEQEESR